MGVDVCAILYLRADRAERAREQDADGVLYWLAEDAASLNLGKNYRWAETKPCEALALFRDEFGDLVALHEDPRGLCLYPNTYEPAGDSYEEIIEKLGGDQAFWAKTNDTSASLNEFTYDEHAMREAGALWTSGKLPKDSPYFDYFQRRYDRLSSVGAGGHSEKTKAFRNWKLLHPKLKKKGVEAARKPPTKSKVGASSTKSSKRH